MSGMFKILNTPRTASAPNKRNLFRKKDLRRVRFLQRRVRFGEHPGALRSPSQGGVGGDKDDQGGGRRSAFASSEAQVFVEPVVRPEDGFALSEGETFGPMLGEVKDSAGEG